MADAILSVVAFDSSLGFAAGTLDRVENLRNDPAAIEGLQATPGSAAVLLAGDEVLLPGADAPWFALPALADLPGIAGRVLLGMREGRALFAIDLEPAGADLLRARPGIATTDLRSIATAGALPPGDVGALAQAKAVLNWHATHRFCGRCGTPTIVAAAGWRRECPHCGLHHFPRTDPVVIMMAVDGERCLLGRQPRFPAGMYSCLAGFVEPGETVENAVRRELAEEAGIATGTVTYLGSQPWPFPMSIMIGCLAAATSTALTIDRAELEDARWFTRQETRLLLEGRHPDGLRCPQPMAIAHHLMRHWVDAGPPPG